MQSQRTRRHFLRRTASAVTVGMGVLSGCSSSNIDATTTVPEFEPSETTTGIGRLALSEVDSVTATATDGLDDTDTDVQTKRAETEGSDRIELEVYGGIMDHSVGTFGMSAGATMGTFWRAPSDGEYEITATYGGKGTYSGPEENPGWDYTVSAGIGLSVLRSPQQDVASRTVRLLNGGNPGIETQIAEKLIESLALRLVSPYLGLVGTIIARAILSWAVDLEPLAPNRGRFLIKPWEPEETALSFAATKGDIYRIDVAPFVGFNLQSHARQWSIPYVSVETWYEVDPISIRRG